MVGKLRRARVKNGWGGGGGWVRIDSDWGWVF